MKNIRTYPEHIKEEVKVYTGYRDANGNVTDLDPDPIDVWPFRPEKDLSGANLSRRFYREAQLDGYDLSGASLRYADLTGANLTGANLTGANLTQADLMFTDFTNANLTDVKGLETCRNVAYARFYGANLTGVSDEFFDLIERIERENIQHEDNSRGLITWEYEGPIPTDETPIEEFLRDCIGDSKNGRLQRIFANARRNRKSKKLFGI